MSFIGCGKNSPLPTPSANVLNFPSDITEYCSGDLSFSVKGLKSKHLFPLKVFFPIEFQEKQRCSPVNI